MEFDYENDEQVWTWDDVVLDPVTVTASPARRTNPKNRTADWRVAKGGHAGHEQRLASCSSGARAGGHAEGKGSWVHQQMV
jgi:hypothetical protein